MIKTILLSILLSASMLFAAPLNTTFFGKLAVDGHDPVAYFTQGKPVKGFKVHQVKWNNANWRFSSQENKDIFLKNPAKYAPQYGGYCAWAMSQGRQADIDPNNWKIVNGKLYLNYNDTIQKRWETDIPDFILKADAMWIHLFDKPKEKA